MFFNRAILVYGKHFLDLVTFSEFKENFPDFRKNKEERYSRVPRLSDTRYSAKETKRKLRYASSKARLKCATYRR